MKRDRVPMLFGWYRSAKRVEDGADGAGHTPESLHAICPGILRRSDDVEKDGTGRIVRVIEADRVVRCVCQCHEGKDIEVPKAAPITRAVPQEKGQRDAKLADQLSDALQKTGTASLPIPEGADAKEQNCLNSRLHTAARRRGMKVSVRKSADGNEWVATVKGGARSEGGKK